jgi:hypothetical protein
MQSLTSLLRQYVSPLAGYPSIQFSEMKALLIHTKWTDDEHTFRIADGVFGDIVYLSQEVDIIDEKS